MDNEIMICFYEMEFSEYQRQAHKVGSLIYKNDQK